MTAKERYKEYSVKVKEYETDFLKLVQDLDISELKKLRLETLFSCFGYTKGLQCQEYNNLANKKMKDNIQKQNINNLKKTYNEI
jgi:hypothetical protein